MKALVSGVGGVLLTYLILLKFGLVGLLITLPIAFALPFVWHWAKTKWQRRGALK